MKQVDVKFFYYVAFYCLSHKNTNIQTVSILQDNYGQTETDHVNKVKEVYRQLNLTEKFKEYKETTQRELVDMIEQLNNNNQLPKEMFYSIKRKSYN